MGSETAPSPEPQASRGFLGPYLATRESDGYFGVWIRGKQYFQTPHEADAHLIAAAPDLYEALAEIMAEGAVVRDDLVDAAHAALAKARGES